MEETSKSLLCRLKGDSSPNEEAWNTLVQCYTPFLRSVLVARGIQFDALDDVIQNIFTVVVRRINEFDRRRVGSFRTWLRTICAHCLREHSRKQATGRAKGMIGAGESKMVRFIQELSDPMSELSRYWDKEHDDFVLAQLLERVRNEFRPKTFEAFKRLAIGNQDVDEVAAELGITANAAFVARSRVLKRLKSLAAGMIE